MKPFNFNQDEYSIQVLAARDQYNDYSVAYDITIRVTDADRSWTQTIVAGGDKLPHIQTAFRKYNNNGWIKPSLS